TMNRAEPARPHRLGQVEVGGPTPPPPPAPHPPPPVNFSPFTRFSNPWAIAENDGNGKPPTITLGEPTRIIPGVPTGGINGWSVPICLVRAAAAASAAA